MEIVALVAFGLGAVVLFVAWTRQRAHRITARERLASAQLAGLAPVRRDLQGVPEETVARWLFLAGMRGADAVPRFWGRTLVFASIGAVLGVLYVASGALDRTIVNLEGIPGRVGFLFVPVVYAIPVLLPLGFGAVPTVAVRRARRRRVARVLADLYPALELFASLAQAGLAFDAALGRVLATFGADRPLGRELMTFQAEILSGADRSRCFRRFAHRIQVPQISSFVAALIRAHEVGIGLAATLRRQADDLRIELRERALARAQSLPARLVFPLVLCFLPGIFVMSLGPAFYGFLVGTAGFGITR